MSSSGLLKKFTKLFPVPKSLDFDFVGIDMCKNTIRVMQLKETKVGKIPYKFREYFLQQECGLMRSEPEYKDCDEVLNILKNIKREFKVNYVNVSIPEIRTYIYRTSVPSNVGKDIYNALRFTVEENVPILPEEVLIDYYVLGVVDNQVEVVVTAVHRKIIEQYALLFENAGLIPVSFEPETHAIARGIIKKGDKNQYLLVNLDSCLSSIAVVQNEVVQYTQTLPITGKNFVEGFYKEEAEVLKENINKVIIYWATTITKQYEESIETVFLAGEHSYSVELLNYLEKNLPVNVKFANVWSNCFDLNDYIPPVHAKESLKFATVTGLSLKKIK